MKWGRGRRDPRRRRDGGGNSHHSPRRDKGNQLRSKVRVWIQNTLFFSPICPSNSSPGASATVNLLAQELEARKELLEALVKDKNDTAV